MTRRDSTSAPSGDVSPDPVRWRVLIVLLTVIFMSLIDVSIVNVAIPSIQAGLGASNADVQWILSGYALTFGIVLVAAGRAGDILGRGGIFIAGVAVFTAASVASGLAPNATWLNVARFVQGVGSGLLNPQALGMIQQYFRGHERARAFGYLGTTVGVSVAIGPVLGGLLIKVGGVDFGWRLTFLVNLPVGITAMALSLAWFPKPLISRPEPAARDGSNGGLRRFDPLGAILLGLAVFVILFPFVEARGAALTWLLALPGLGLVALWVAWERHYARAGHNPMVDLGIFATRSFANGTALMVLYFLGMTSIWVLVALYVQEGLGRTALESGAMGVPSAVATALAANWSGKRVMRYGRKVVIGGMLLGLLGLASSVLVVYLQQRGLASVWWLLLSLTFVGCAQGAVISPNQTLTLADVPLRYAGSSGAVMQTGQRIGTSVGIAVITAAVFATRSVTNWSVATMTGFALIGGVVLLALGVAIKDQRDRGKAAAIPNHDGSAPRR